MKAYLINTTERTVTTVDWDRSLESLYDMLGCKTIEAARWFTGDYVYLDEEGKIGPPKAGFAIPACFHEPMAGNGLIVGSPDGWGEDMPPGVPIEYYQQHIHWLEEVTLEHVKP
jgi:hypothetical protein